MTTARTAAAVIGGTLAIVAAGVLVYAAAGLAGIMGPLTVRDVAELAGVALWQGLASPLTWATVALAALLPVVAERCARDGGKQ